MAARVALGIAFGALWRAGQRYAAAPLPGLVHWALVRHTALALCGRDASAAPPSQLAAAYERHVATSTRLIERYLRTRLPQAVQRVHILSRAGWVEANLVGLRQLLAPRAGLVPESDGPGALGHHTLGSAAQVFVSLQLGMLLGYLARRVLGQYDLAILGSEPVVQGRLYFVEPNIAALERRLGLPREEFRLWLALHETTHAFEFEAHPWLRDYLAGLLRRYLATLEEDVLAMRPPWGSRWLTLARFVSNALQSQYVIEVVMSAEQREVFRAMQAAMAVLEGYSNHVMDRVGADLFPNYADLRGRFERRLLERTSVERLGQWLSGLNIKLEQYALGEHFVNAVVERVGITGVNRVWSGPEALPRLDEVRAPERWLARVGEAGR